MAEIQPASIDQLVAGRDGQMILIPNDVGGVAASLRSIDPHIHLRYSETGDYYVVYGKDEGGTEYLITTAQDCDHRLVHRIEDLVIRSKEPGYSFADEIETADERNQAQKKTVEAEERRDAAERLAHGIRKDYGFPKNRIFIEGR